MRPKSLSERFVAWAMFYEISKRATRSISTRMTLLFVASFAVCLIGAFVFTYLEFSYSLEKLSREVISAKFREMDTVLEKGEVKGLKEFLASEEERLRNVPFMVRVLTDEGKTLFFKPSQQEKKFDFDALYQRFTRPKEMEGWRALQAINDEDFFDILTERVGPGIYLQIGKSSEDREDFLENLSYIFGFATIAFIILSVALGRWYARRALRPLRDLTDTIVSIEKGDFTHRVPESNSQDELKELSTTFNRMVGRIERLVVGMKQSLDNLAHDVRTPLTRARVRVESAILSGNPTESGAALEDTAENIHELTALVDQLLDISEADAGAIKLKIHREDIPKIGDEVVDLYQVVADEKNISLLNHIERGLAWQVDRRRVKRALANLVDNAIKFSPERTIVTIRGYEKNNRLTLEVTDQGKGVSAEDLPHIWDRLYRGDHSRSEKGMGLGLALVRSIVTAHGGLAEAEAIPEGGSCFRIILPSGGA